jgi:hypothetical protein
MGLKYPSEEKCKEKEELLFQRCRNLHPSPGKMEKEEK